MNEIIIPNYSFLRIKPTKYINIILLIIIIFIIGISFVKITTTIEIPAYINDNQIHLLCPYLEIKNLVNSKELYIDNNKYSYTVSNIDSEIKLIDNQNIQEVKLNLKLPNKYKINNLLLTTKIIKSEKTLYQKILDILIERE